MNNITTFIQKIPKAELHVHIEGTFEPEQMFEIADRNNVPMKYKNVDELRKAYIFNNLQEFLDIYYLGTRVLKTELDFYELTTAYLRKASEQNILHTEIFFDPQTHLDNGIDFPVFFNGIHNAITDAHKKYRIQASLIMCFLRHLDEKSAYETLKKAMPFRDQIVAIGLDSSEKGNPPEKFAGVFSKARQLGFLTVAHAGEEGPADYVRSSLDTLHVSRIDHGNRSIDDEALLNELSEKQIPLTLCPLSNLRLRVVKDLKHHPLKLFLKKNILATINSDDPAYFGGYLNENYLAIQAALNLTPQEIITLARNSFTASFLSQEEKNRYILTIEKYAMASLQN